MLCYILSTIYMCTQFSLSTYVQKLIIYIKKKNSINLFPILHIAQQQTSAYVLSTILLNSLPKLTYTYLLAY